MVNKKNNKSKNNKSSKDNKKNKNNSNKKVMKLNEMENINEIEESQIEKTIIKNVIKGGFCSKYKNNACNKISIKIDPIAPIADFLNFILNLVQDGPLRFLTDGFAFIIKEIYSSSIILFSLISFILAWTFISLQIKEFRNMGFSINDSVYSSVFFFLTGLHFFHVVVGIILISILFWSCSYNYIINLRNHFGNFVEIPVFL